MTTVLVVDDHGPFRVFVRGLLSGGGFEVVGEASNGAEAIAATRELRPDVVLLDVQLPDFDGFEVAPRLVEIEAGVRVVLTSTREAADYGRRVAESPALGFISKADLSAESLTSILKRL